MPSVKSVDRPSPMNNKIIAFALTAAAMTPHLIVSLAIAALFVPASEGPGQNKSATSDSNASPGVPNTLEDTLIALEKKSWEAWKNRDGKFFDEFLSDDHLEVGFGG